jgi:hypothetical protein
MTKFDNVPHYTVFVTFKNKQEREKLFLSSLERRDRRLLSSWVTDITDDVSDLTFSTTKLDVARRIQSNTRSILKNNRFAGKVQIASWDENCENCKSIR